MRNRNSKPNKQSLMIGTSFEIGPGHNKKKQTEKLYKKGKGTDNPHEKEMFLKRTGPQLPLAKGKGKRTRRA